MYVDGWLVNFRQLEFMYIIWKVERPKFHLFNQLFDILRFGFGFSFSSSGTQHSLLFEKLEAFLNLSGQVTFAACCHGNALQALAIAANHKGIYQNLAIDE